MFPGDALTVTNRYSGGNLALRGLGRNNSRADKAATSAQRVATSRQVLITAPVVGVLFFLPAPAG